MWFPVAIFDFLYFLHNVIDGDWGPEAHYASTGCQYYWFCEKRDQRVSMRDNGLALAVLKAACYKQQPKMTTGCTKKTELGTIVNASSSELSRMAVLIW